MTNGFHPQKEFLPKKRAKKESSEKKAATTVRQVKPKAR